MEQREIKRERKKLEKKMGKVFQAVIKITECLLELERICKNPIHKKGRRQICPDCGKRLRLQKENKKL